MSKHAVCFSGHRIIADPACLEACLRAVVIRLIDAGCTDFLTGGAQGFDALAAEVVLSLRAQFPHIRLCLVLPCRDQAKGWPEPAQNRYEAIREEADEVRFLSERYFRGCMHQRNRFLVDHSSICVCYLTQNHGGTFYTVNYAKKKGLHIVHLAEPIEP